MAIRLQQIQNTEILISQALILGGPAKQFGFMWGFFSEENVLSMEFC